MRVLILLAVSMVAAMGEPDWRFAHPQAEVLVGVSTNALLESAWADLVQKHFVAHGLPDPVKIAEALDEVNFVYMSSFKQDGLMMLTGTFDGGKTVEFLRKQGFEPRFLNRTIILLGDEADMDIAGARLKDEKLQVEVRRGDFVNPLFIRARQLSHEYDCWMVGVMVPAMVAELPKAFHDVRSFSYGLNLDETSELKATLNMRSRDGAEKLGALLERFQGESAEAGSALKVTASGVSVAVEFAVEQKAFIETLPKLTAAWGRVTDPKPLLASTSAGTPVPVPPARKTVMIFGLESGMKEHGFTPR